LNDRIKYLEARDGMGSDKTIAYLQGFCPSGKTDQIQEKARQQGWGLVIEEPSTNDRVPTLIENPPWIKPIKALFEAIEILPGYHEVDANAAFLVFFSIFFGILVGDAGYGAIFLVLTILGRFKFKKAPLYPFWLLGILSTSTIIWGSMTGNYFGCKISALDKIARIEWLASDRNLFIMCFLMGAIHLTIAHTWRAAVNLKNSKAIGQVGWIISTWFMFFAAKYLVLGESSPKWLVHVFVAGVGMIILDILFRFKEEASSLLTLFFDIIGNFVDIVSYIRLYAVGMAGLAVAQAFNDLALGADGKVEGILAGIGAALILFLGHTLNMVLCLMSVLVHGVRLNTLEFSGHIGLEWSGFPYQPFLSNSKEKKEQ
jgi:V/A-type H+-transporting ATPase subunit I